MPFPFFGTMLHGKAMLIYYPLSVLLLLAAGGALLKNKVWGYWLALAIHLFNFLNVSAMIVLPGRAARLQGLMESVPFKLPPGAELPSNFLVTMEVFGLGAGLILSLIVLSLLLISRKRFFELAAIQAPPATSAG